MPVALFTGGLVKGREPCYEWNHVNPDEKPVDTSMERWTISGVCGWSKRLPEQEWKARIMADRARCELLCASCHHVGTRE